MSSRSARRGSRARGATCRSSRTRPRSWKALEAAEQLERDDGLSVEVLDLRTLLPLDDEAIVATVKKTNRVLVVHEDTRTGGIAGEITARINELAFEWLDAPVRRVAAHDVPLPAAPGARGLRAAANGGHRRRSPVAGGVLRGRGFTWLGSTS